ncbi:MAG: ACP S-malonyltransferase [Candidatus Eremiobacteraeota bacterium]|nr:ACP S-malonyltransferase [Candidatus Eremiobacteraeota bacterium]
MKAAVVFPGQGSQIVGMGVDIARADPEAAHIFERASAVLGYDLLEMQRSGPEERLRETRYSQPAIFTTNVALYAAAARALSPVVSAGHSFGEICSLTIAGSLTLEGAVRIVDARAKAMHDAAGMSPGAMAAVLGIDDRVLREVVDTVVRDGHGRVQLANFNSPSQIVISGDMKAVDAATDALLEAGAKRVVPLNVSGAWHSVLMEPAIAPFTAAVDQAAISLPAFDVLSNVDARPYRDVQTIRANLVRSITSEVRWHDAAMALLAYDPGLIVEFGATPVLGPLMRRLPGAPEIVTVADRAGVEKLLGVLQASAGAGS